MAQIMNSLLPNSDILKKEGKTTRTFRYDLNQIPYDLWIMIPYLYSRSDKRFKELDLIDGVPEELRTEVCDIVEEAVIETIPKKKKCKEANWLAEEALQRAMKRREAKDKSTHVHHQTVNTEVR